MNAMTEDVSTFFVAGKAIGNFTRSEEPKDHQLLEAR